MANEELFKSFQSAIRDVLSSPSLEVNPDSTLFGDLGLESIDLLDLSCDLEKSIGRELDFKEVFKKVTETRGSPVNEVSVGDVVAFLQSN